MFCFFLLHVDDDFLVEWGRGAGGGVTKVITSYEEGSRQ